MIHMPVYVVQDTTYCRGYLLHTLRLVVHCDVSQCLFSRQHTTRTIHLSQDASVWWLSLVIHLVPCPCARVCTCESTREISPWETKGSRLVDQGS